jgi:hypothetical protein
MAKTYNTISTFTSGQVLTAAQMNEIGTNSNNYRVPPICIAYRSSNLTAYANGTKIAWQASDVDTDPTMWAVGSATKVIINTTGLYLVTFIGSLSATATLGFWEPNIFVNNTRAASNSQSGSGLGTGGAFCVSVQLKLAATDEIEAAVGISGGSNYTINGGSLPAHSTTRLIVAWLGQVS